MEDNLLNFNQPFLSVRRRTPTLVSKQSDNRKTNYSRPDIPRLPPHRSELKSGPIRNPGSVPFLWEQTPGQPKEEATPNTQNHDRPPIVPKLPPGRYPKAKPKDSDKPSPSPSVGRSQAVNVPATSDEKKETFYVSDENVKNVETSKETTEEKESSDSGGSDAFVDALDTLSRTESTFLNCSTSGLNELDNVDTKSAEVFSMDPQAQKFMMDRFLPAAKAMASDTVHYAPKRQPAAQEQLNQQKKEVNQYKPSLRYGPSFAKRYSEYCGNEEEEEDSEKDDDQHENMPAACGLLPRFCFKGSIGRFSPVPGMSVRTRVPISSYRTQRRSPSDGFYSGTDNELKSYANGRKSIEKVQSAEVVERKTQLRHDDEDCQKHTAATHSHAPWPFIGKREIPVDPEQQKNDDRNDSGIHGKGIKTFQEVLADQDSPKELDSGSSAVEKTLYVDTVQKLEHPSLMPPAWDRQDTKGFPTSRAYHEIATERMDQIHTEDSADDDSKMLEDACGGENLLANAHKVDDSNISSSFDEPNGMQGLNKTNATTTTGTTEPIKETADDSEKPLLSHSELLAPPPLPKSPSDSWLLRTLPGISKNHLNAAKNPQNHGSNAPKNDVKWETIVKTTKLQHRHLHHSVGMLTTIPEA